MQGTVAGVTTVYIGKAFEYSAGVGKKYFSAAGTMVAMRSGSNGLQWLAGDHLGSTSVSSDASGLNPLRQTYYPWGENRYPTTSSLPTTMRYTGQRAEVSLGIYFYGARWYDPVLGRFLSPDSIIPQGQGVQAWDRYAYANNNAVRYNDPSGHAATDDGGGGEDTTPLWLYLVDDWLWKNIPSAIELQIGVSGQIGIFAEPVVNPIEGSVVFNWRSGQISTFTSGGGGVYAGTPSVIGGNVYGGVTKYYGVSDNRFLNGTSIVSSQKVGVNSPRFDTSKYSKNRLNLAQDD